MNTPKEILNNFIVTNIAPTMKINGFSKYGKTWIKHSDEITYVINIQSNKWNLQGEPVEIFINYGIYSPSDYKKRFKLSALPKRPMEYDCALRMRLRDSDDSEVWTIELDGRERTSSLINHIKNVVFPFFESIKNQADLDRYLGS